MRSGIVLVIAANQAGSACSLFLQRLHPWAGRTGSGTGYVKVCANMKWTTFLRLSAKASGKPLSSRSY